MKRTLFELGAMLSGLALIYLGSQALHISLGSLSSATLGACVAWPLAALGTSVHDYLYRDEVVANLRRRVERHESQKTHL